MAIRLGNNCQNCENLKADKVCKVHGVEVSGNYTCDQFEMKAALKDDRNCTTCLRYEREDCANPQHAAPGMMCASWAPKRVSA